LPKGANYGECRARAYNGGPEAEPPAWSRDRVPGGAKGTKPPEAESFFVHFLTKGRPKVKDLNEIM